MTPTLANPRTLDVASLAAPDMDVHQVQKLRVLLTRLNGCDMGRRLINVAVRHRLTFRLATRQELMTSRGPSGGHYDPKARSVVVTSDADADWQVTTLAHELQHFVDHMYGWQLGTVQSEVRAQQTEALVIRQLHLAVTDCWALSPTGQLRPPEAVAAEVRSHRLYAHFPEEMMRVDGRIHPLCEPHEVLPSLSLVTRGSSSGMRIGAAAPIAVTASVGPVGPVDAISTGAVTQAVCSALGSRTPTGWDPEAAALADTNVERFMQTLDAHRLAMGA